MATVTSPRNVAESQARVRHPLDSLRATIRRYVTLEGVAVLLVLVAAYFWVGLAVDYGAFRLLTVDWVQILPVGFRAGVLIALVACLLAVLAVKILFRLFSEFRDSSLALVLERRYPELLGDRLITAVELADRQKAERYGYSTAMIDQTIRDAAERVEQAPVRDVFNWRRLRRLALWAGILVVGVYLLAGAVACGVDYARGQRAGLAGFGRLNEAAELWFERNVLLRNTIWPRRAYLEMVGFPESGEIKIGEGMPSPSVRVRAYKWVVADAAAPEGLRPLTWGDLKRPELLGDAAPALPESWLGRRPDWTVDQVELQLTRLELDQARAVRQVLRGLDQFTKVKNITVNGNRFVIQDANAAEPRPLTWDDLKANAAAVLPDGEKLPDLPALWLTDQQNPTVEWIEAKLKEMQIERLAALQDEGLAPLEAIDASRRLKRQLRKLTVPDEVVIHAWGKTTRSDIPLQKQGDNEYGGTFPELRESVLFRVRGEDYYSRPYKVTLVPPPQLVSLTRDEYRPAYLYYRVPDGATADDVKNMRQLFQGQGASISGSESRMEVPAGSDEVLTGTADKDLQSARILPPREGVPAVKATVELVGERSFRTRFDNIRQPLDFVFEFTDTDGVTGLRHVIIKPLEDTAPEAEVQVEVLRKTNQGYLVTTDALVPFTGKVRDDHGLQDVQFAYNLTRVDSQEGLPGGKGLALFRLLLQMGGGVGQDLRTAAQVAAAAGEPTKPEPAAPKGPTRTTVPSFAQKLSELRGREATRTLDEMRQRVRQSPTRERPVAVLLKEFALEPDRPDVMPKSGFDLLDLPDKLRVASESDIQPHYRLQLWVEAVDTDLETGPHRSASKDKFSFLVVSENELLAEVAKEEEVLHLKLDDMVYKLTEARAKMDQIIGDLASPNLKPEVFGPMSVRSEEIGQLLDRSQTTTEDVLKDYARILLELEFNRVQAATRTKKETEVRNPLEAIRNQQFPRAIQGMVELRKVLDNETLPLADRVGQARTGAKEARDRLEELIAKLQAVLSSMEGITTYNKILKQLVAIEEENRKLHDIIEQLQKQIKESLFKDLGVFDDEPAPKKDK